MLVPYSTTATSHLAFGGLGRGLKRFLKLSMVARACNPGTRDGKAGDGFEVYYGHLYSSCTTGGCTYKMSRFGCH